MATESTGTDMNPEVVQVLQREGAVLVILNVPESTEFGIDYNSWITGPRFRGVKMIPPGIHYVYYSAVNSKYGNDTAPRTGFFHNFKKRELLVKKWNAFTEDIEDTVLTDEEKDRFQSNRREMDRYLGVYPYENFKKWVSLTNHITDRLLVKLSPISGRISSVIQLKSEASNSKDRLEKKIKLETMQSRNADAGDCHHGDGSGDSLLPLMDTVPGTSICFTEIPKQKYPQGATAKEMTKYSMDSSYALSILLNEEYGNEINTILGEIQFAFVCFLIGQVYDAFEQWKQLVHLLCTSGEALMQHGELFSQFISLLHYHIREIPEDFFVDIVSCNNFLTTTLQEFFSNLEINDVDERVRKRGLLFRDHLTKRFSWDFTTEPDDYAPTVVD